MLKVGSLFSGIGGIDIGFEQAGCKVIWANEKDKNASKTYRNNFDGVHLIERDIKTVDVRTIPNIDILTAGFPCQPFSSMGYQRGFKDPRGNLFFEIARVIEAKMPKIILIENVKNLIEHDKGKTFLTIYNTLARFGYVVKYKIMNAMEYANRPQDRSRIFIIAFLEYTICDRFSFPESVELSLSINNVINRS